MLTLMVKSLKERSRELGRRRFLQWPRRRWSEEMVKFVGTGASQQARVGEKVAGDEAEL
jgi:hypothetical protein